MSFRLLSHYIASFEAIKGSLAGIPLIICLEREPEAGSSARMEPAVYGTVRTVVWEDGGMSLPPTIRLQGIG
ncbi:MAG: hypothetical protein JXB48_11130 [Candidatus Latescibacteria bacterium]|nr:hypothetical protein [Candidatus Latescibacterota bacterium]